MKEHMREHMKENMNEAHERAHEGKHKHKGTHEHMNVPPSLHSHLASDSLKVNISSSWAPNLKTPE